MKQQTLLLDIVHELVEAAGVKDAFETKRQFHLRLEQEGYEPLVIESWPAKNPYRGEKRQISIGHYFYQGGDAIADPELVMSDEGDPIEMDQVLGYTAVLFKSARGSTMVNARAKKDVEAFMALWARNLSEQGWLAVAARYKQEHAQQTRTKNLCAKTVKPESAYEVWQCEDHPEYGGQWTWYVLKKYQSPEKEAANPYARWLCFVTSPYVPDGEYGDVYVSEIKVQAHKLDDNPLAQTRKSSEQ